MRFYKILQAKQCGNAEGLTAYERQFVEYLKKIDIKTITGVLPLTFTAKGGTAADWVIEGNDENGTENLCPPFNLQGLYSSGVLMPSNEFISTEIFECEPNTTYRFSCDQLLTWAIFALFDENHTFIETINRYNNTYFVINIPSSAHYVGITGKSGPLTHVGDITNQSFTKGSTAPDHYIPYQQGVGERTENELKLNDYAQTINGVKFTLDGGNGTVTAKGRATALTLIKIGQITFLQGTYRVQGCPSGGSYNSYRIDVRTIATTLYQNTADYGDGAAFTVDTDNTTLEFYVRCAQNVDYDLTFYPLVKSGSGAINFIPYGYQIPLTVSQQGQPDKTVDIYIGDSPLTEGQQVSKTSTGQDIELFGGENTISTTLYNKPEMEIKYK